MLALKLAFKNLIGAGLRTWLNVAVLSFAFVLMIFYNAMIDGWNRQGRNDTIDWETGSGQFWHPAYDKYDPYTLADSHNLMSEQVNTQIETGNLTPLLIRQASIYPQGRMQSVMLRGVDPNQKILKLPTADIQNSQNKYAAIIGRHMAESAKLSVGDKVLMRWRDKNGTFDAREIEIVAIFKADVAGIDNGNIYMDIAVLQEMTNLKNQATLLIAAKDYQNTKLEGWEYKGLDFLLAEFDQIIEAKKFGGTIMEGMLLIIALLAIFDTQVLSIFRRQKEIGTYIALGLTRGNVVKIFTVEGAAHSILAAILGSIYGIPFFLYINSIGLSFGTDQMGITIAEVIYPYYSLGLIITSVLLVVISATIVSYMPARKISRMKPTEALKGKIQ